MKVFYLLFEGEKFPLVQTDDGQLYVPLKPICAAIGARWAAQERKMHRGDTYKSTLIHVRALDAHDPTPVIPAIRLFGWLRSFHNGLAKDPVAQEKNAKFQDGFVDAIATFMLENRPIGAQQDEGVDDKDWRFAAIEARLDRVERRLKRNAGEG